MAKPNFAALSVLELSAWYIEHVGYDLALEDPEMSINEYRDICSDLHDLHAEGEAQ